jgi:hypothetical protein
MVSRYDDSRLLIVLQIDHSRVAGFIGAHWGNARFRAAEPYLSMVLTAQEHDNGWWEWEVKPSMSETGRAVDYQSGGVPRSAHNLGYWNGVNRVAERDPYAGLLVTMHAMGLENQVFGMYPSRPNRADKPEVKDYMGRLEALRARLLEQLQQDPVYRPYVAEDVLWRNFKLLEAWELLAQLVCNRFPLTADRPRPSLTLSDFPVPTDAGEEFTTITVDVQDGNTAILQPYPFGTDPLRISFPGRVMADEPHESHEAFLQDFYRAEPVWVTHTLRSA